MIWICLGATFVSNTLLVAEVGELAQLVAMEISLDSCMLLSGQRLQEALFLSELRGELRIVRNTVAAPV